MDKDKRNFLLATIFLTIVLLSVDVLVFHYFTPDNTIVEDIIQPVNQTEEFCIINNATVNWVTTYVPVNFSYKLYSGDTVPVVDSFNDIVFTDNDTGYSFCLTHHVQDAGGAYGKIQKYYQKLEQCPNQYDIVMNMWWLQDSVVLKNIPSTINEDNFDAFLKSYVPLDFLVFSQEYNYAKSSSIILQHQEYHEFIGGQNSFDYWYGIFKNTYACQ